LDNTLFKLFSSQ